MILKRITYENFRNHSDLTYEPDEGINLIYGPNGSGKTSILEGIHYCALTRGFVSAGDLDCLAFSKEYFLIKGDFLNEEKRELNVQVSCTNEKEKQVSCNNTEVKPFSRHIGRIPCITFTPSEITIVTGSPSERRKFIDNAISQTDRRYLEDLMAYRKVLTQRNTLLLQLHDTRVNHDETLSIWSEIIAGLAAAIVKKRKSFIFEFSDRLQEMFGDLGLRETPGVAYRCSLPQPLMGETEDELRETFIRRLRETEKIDIRRAQTMTGPHRDDIVFIQDHREIKRYASQGQMRTFLLCLKLSQHRLYREKLGERPICLLDDIFSELDAYRTSGIIGILESFGQSIITSAEKKEQRRMTAISMEKIKKKEEEKA